MPYRTLHALVLEAHAKLAELEASEGPAPAIEDDGHLRFAAVAVADGTWGTWARQQPILINVAALALRLRDRLELTQVRPGAARLVAETDLHSLPVEPPRLLRAPAVLLEVRRPEALERLFGDTVALGAYRLGDGWYVVGLDYPDGVWGGRWDPSWTGGELDAGVVVDDSPLIATERGEQQNESMRQAARLLVVLGTLLDAEGAPLREDIERPPKAKTVVPIRGPRGWTTRHLYLDDRRPPSGAGEPRAAAGSPPPGEESEEVPVRGHLKRQPHGPGGALRRWIWIDGYEARRWVSPRPRLTVVR